MTTELTPKTKEAVDKAVAAALQGRNKVENGGLKVKIDVPVLNPKNVDVYLKEIKVWDKLTKGITDEEKSLMLWSKLPTENAQGIKDKIDPDLDLTVEKFKEIIGATFKPNQDVEQNDAENRMKL